MKSNRQSAFSLVELIVVAAVIAVIIGFAVPAANNLIRGSQLTQGAQAFADIFAYARQYAISRNRQVEIRFYRYGDLDTPGELANTTSSWRFHGYQLFEIIENGAALPINKMQRLPKMVILSTGPTELYLSSTLLCPALRGKFTQAALDKTTPEIPVTFSGDSNKATSVGRKYEFTSFRYLQDGSTDLPTSTKATAGGAGRADDSWYVTLVGLNDNEVDINTVNFYTVQIDPISGATKGYRPGGS
jgi:uncharacterized protein (TIGR02596 family)